MSLPVLLQWSGQIQLIGPLDHHVSIYKAPVLNPRGAIERQQRRLMMDLAVHLQIDRVVFPYHVIGLVEARMRGARGARDVRSGMDVKDMEHHLLELRIPA